MTSLPIETIGELIVRLLVAGLFGGVIGIDRTYREKEAGLRTHFLVAVGSALFMIISQYGFGDVHGLNDGRYDGSRVAAQIVTGIGFIGAGSIIFHKRMIRGLTTAAGLWTASGIGMAVGGATAYLKGAMAGSMMRRSAKKTARKAMKNMESILGDVRYMFR